MALITLQHTDINSGNKVSIPGSSMTIGYSKTTMADPNANYDEDTPVVRGQSKSIANPIYTIKNITIDFSVIRDGVLEFTYGGYVAITQEMLKQFVTLSNDDSDPILLNIQYGSSESWTSLNKYTGSRVADIPVTINGGVNVNLSALDSDSAYMPIASLTLLEVLKE